MIKSDAINLHLLLITVSLTLYHTTLYISSVFAVDRCPSVCPSVCLSVYVAVIVVLLNARSKSNQPKVKVKVINTQNQVRIVF